MGSKDVRALVGAFGDLFDEVQPRTKGEIDEILRDEGYDPDELGVRLGDAVKAAMAGAFVVSQPKGAAIPVDESNRD